jgi:hypothetical protein
MVVHEDLLRHFIPKNDIKFMILGTMVAINARVINGIKPKEDVFYYNNNRNHFWRVLQSLLEPNKTVIKNLSILEKKNLLNRNGIAICNLVKKVEVPNRYKYDPSDTVLFEAYGNSKIEFKTVSNKMKKVLTNSPLFFTCRRKKGIELLLEGFLLKNKIKLNIREQIWYWPTPTRCNPQARAKIWKQEMIQFQKNR